MSPVSPVLAGEFFTTVPMGSPNTVPVVATSQALVPPHRGLLGSSL